jgi:hypothetical protein
VLAINLGEVMQKRIKRDRRARAACGGVSVLAAALVLSAGCTPEGASAPSLADMPKVAAGKWRVTIMVDGKGGEFSSDLCESEKTIDDLLITGLPGNGSNCKDRTFEQVSATSWALHSACNFAGTGDRKAETVVTIDTRVSGDLKSHYQAESKQVMSQPMNGVSQQTILQKAERVGDC